MKIFLTSAASVLLCMLTSTPCPGGDRDYPDKVPVEVDSSPQSPWKFDLGIPVWAAWSEGSFIKPDLDTSGKLGFDEALDGLDGFAALNFGAKYSRFSYRLDLFYVELSPGKTFENRRLDERFTVESEQTKLDQYLFYDIVQEDRLTVSVGGGARWSAYDTTRTVTGTSGHHPIGFRDPTESDFWDAVIAAEVKYWVTDRLFLRVFGDFGGTGSDETWQIYAGGGYHLTESWYLSLDYRHLVQDIFEAGTTDTHLEYKGPQIGLTFTF